MKKIIGGIFQQVKLKLFELTFDEELGPSDPLRLPRPALGKIISSSISAETAPPRPPIPPELPVFPWILTNFGFTRISSSMVEMWLSKLMRFSTSVSRWRNILTVLYRSGLVSNLTIPEVQKNIYNVKKFHIQVIFEQNW